MQLQITDVNNNPVSWITWSPAVGSILVAPQLDTPLGMIELKYKVTMTNYPTRTATQSFFV